MISRTTPDDAPTAPECPPPLPKECRRILRQAWWIALALALPTLAWGVWTLAKRSEPKAPASSANPVYSHSLDIHDMGCSKDALVGGFSISPDGRRLGVITTTRQGNPDKLVLCDLDGNHAVIAPTGDWEHRPPLWCSGNRIVTGTSRCDWNAETKTSTYWLTVWDATSGKKVAQVSTEGMFFGGAVNPTRRNEVVLLPHFGGAFWKNFPPALYKWDLDSGTLSALPKIGLSYKGATWLSDGDILAYGIVYPLKSLAGKRNSMISEGDTVIVRLDAEGREMRRTSQPIYKTTSYGDRTVKSLLTSIQPSSLGIAHLGAGIWPIISTPVGAWVDIANLRIIDKQDRFSGFGAWANMATGAASVSADGKYIYFGSGIVK